jgi:hypothetical protein
VIFVAAVSEYDQVRCCDSRNVAVVGVETSCTCVCNQLLYEDATQNRMMEALNLFDEICNSR